MSPEDQIHASSVVRNSYRHFQEWLPTTPLYNALYNVSNALLLLTALSLILSIFFRTYNIGIQGMQSAAQLFAVWLSFLVAGNLELDGQHIEVDYFANKLSPRIRRAVDVFRLLVCLFCTSFIALSALLAVQKFWDSTIPTINIPAPTLHAAPFIGMSFLSLLYLHKLLLQFSEEDSSNG